MTKLERLILNAPVVRFAVAKSKQIVLPGFDHVPLYDVTKFFINQVKKVGLNDRARSISFSFLTAIPAAAIFLCTLVPYFPISKEITRQLLLITKEITPNQNTYVMVSDFLKDFLNKPRNGLLSFGFVLAIFYSSNAMLGIMRSFNKSLIYNTRQSFFQTRWMAIKLTILLILLVIGSMIILVTQDELLKNLLQWMNIKRHD